MDRKIGYFENREYESSGALKNYDPNEKQLPITYTAGCTRRIAKFASRRTEQMKPQFGTLLFNPLYMPLVLEACSYYQRMLALTVLMIYGEPVSMEDIDEITPEIAADILVRFYPSSYNWIVSCDSRGYIHGRVENPRQQPEDICNILGKDPDIRHEYFRADYKTGKYIVPNYSLGFLTRA